MQVYGHPYGQSNDFCKKAVQHPPTSSVTIENAFLANAVRRMDMPPSIADYLALASAANFVEDRGATTSQVLKHLAPSVNFQAEASAK